MITFKDLKNDKDRITYLSAFRIQADLSISAMLEVMKENPNCTLKCSEFAELIKDHIIAKMSEQKISDRFNFMKDPLGDQN